MNALVKAYNNEYSRVIGMSPNEYIAKKIKKNVRNEYSPYKYKVGDKVRIKLQLKATDKGFGERWSRVVSMVEKRLHRNGLNFYYINGKGHRENDLQLIRK